MITGIAGLDVKVSCSVDLVIITDPSFTIRVTPELPVTFGVPEIKPVTGSAFNPGGKPVALKRAEALPPVVNTSNLKGCPVLAVMLVPLLITVPEPGIG
jgi:hypothetical protein